MKFPRDLDVGATSVPLGGCALGNHGKSRGGVVGADISNECQGNSLFLDHANLDHRIIRSISLHNYPRDLNMSSLLMYLTSNDNTDNTRSI